LNALKVFVLIVQRKLQIIDCNSTFTTHQISALINLSF